MVLGHEGAGVVAEIGAGVTGFNVGDHVVLSFAPACGVCSYCKNKQPQFCTVGGPHGRMLDGTARMHDKTGADLGVMQFLGCMAEQVIVPAISACVIDKQIPLDKAALVGCGVMTGGRGDQHREGHARLVGRGVRLRRGGALDHQGAARGRPRSSRSTWPTRSSRWRVTSAPRTP
jgi:Zn-dependent alcohol dehydrogenase